MAGVLYQVRKQAQVNQLAGFTAVVCMALCLAACGGKEKAAAGQSLVSVNGTDITVLQVNEELARANVPADKKAEATKQILEVLINQRLLADSAAKNKIDRDPAVVAAIERAKAQIIAQATIQKHLATVARPTKDDIDKYYADHPDLFGDRKQFDVDQVAIKTDDFSSEIKGMMGPTKTLEDIMAWMKDHHVEFAHNAASVSSADLPEQLLKKIKEMHKGQLFALQQGAKTVIFTLRGVKDSPAKPEVADVQIAKFLQDQRNKDATGAELARLRAEAKIQYLTKVQPDKAADPAVPAKQDAVTDHIKKGVADL